MLLAVVLGGQRGGPFNDLDRATLYGGDAHGYLDYPTLDESAA